MYTHLLTSKLRTLGCMQNEKYFWSFPHVGLNILSLGIPYVLRKLGFDPSSPLWSTIY